MTRRRHRSNLVPGSNRNQRIVTPMSPPGVIGQWRGPNLLVDGDMEAVGVGAWTVLNSVLTKQPDGVGGQVLRVTGIGVGNCSGYQTILTGGLTYRISGRARGDGVSPVRVETTLGASDVLNGTNSTNWQYYDVVVAAASVNFICRGPALLGGFSEHDNIYVSLVA